MAVKRSLRIRNEALALRLAECALGRVLLHLVALGRSRRNVRWHVRCIVREFSRN